jgi:lysophospholipase L1-like esterase
MSNLSFSTKAATAANETVPLDVDVTGSSIVIEFSDREDFANVVLTKSSTGAGRSVTISLSATDVDTLKGGSYRIKSNGTVVAYGHVGYDLSAPGGFPSSDASVAALVGGSTATATRLKATLGSATVGNRLRRAAAASSRKDGLLPVMTTPPTVTAAGGTNPDASLTKSYRVSTGNIPSFRFTGGILSSSFYGSVYQTVYDVTMPSGTGGNTAGDATHYNYSWAVEFMTDAPKLLLRILTTGYIGLEVNDQLTSASAIAVGGAGGQYVTVDFTGAGGAAIRKIRVEFALSSGFDGVYVGPTYSVWPTTSETNLRIASVGDSVCGSTGATQAGTPWQKVCGKILGWADTRQVAFGGSGFVVPGSYNTFGSARRVADVVLHNPDVLLISATGNDNNQPGIQTSALAAFQAYRTALPAVPIVVTGVDTFLGTGNISAALAAQKATETAVKTAFDQWADPNSWFIPIYNSPDGPWHSGNSTTGATNGSGISDRLTADGTHPNDLGHQWFGARVASAFRTISLPNIV